MRATAADSATLWRAAAARRSACRAAAWWPPWRSTRAERSWMIPARAKSFAARGSGSPALLGWVMVGSARAAPGVVRFDATSRATVAPRGRLRCGGGEVRRASAGLAAAAAVAGLGAPRAGARRGVVARFDGRSMIVRRGGAGALSSYGRYGALPRCVDRPGVRRCSLAGAGRGARRRRRRPEVSSSARRCASGSASSRGKRSRSSWTRARCRRLPDLGQFGAADPVAAPGGAELGDGPAGGGDRELLAGFGTAQDRGDVVAQLVVRDHRHGHGGGGSTTRRVVAFAAQPEYLLPSAEPAGAVKRSPSGPSAASREAGCLTGAGRRSYPPARARPPRASALRTGGAVESRPGGPPGRRPALPACARTGCPRRRGRAAAGSGAPRARCSCAAGLGAVLEVDAVQLERDALIAGAGDVLARLEAGRRS